MSFDLKEYMSKYCRLIDDEMKKTFIPSSDTDPAKLYEAMHYSLFAPGKRIRPILCFASAEALQINPLDILPLAAALEMIHVFSLIHDDLPAMDDDDRRRGLPTNHKVFGEAVAILAADALHTLAFETLTRLSPEKFSPEAILKTVRALANATGSFGMIGGQVIDIESEGKNIDLNRLKKLHSLKTGALIRVAVRAPAILAGSTPDKLAHLTAYGEAIGLAFQIADDILDIEGGEDLGKDIGSDIENKKATYPSLMGLDGAKKEAQNTLSKAVHSLDIFGDRAKPLVQIAHFIIERRS